MEQYRVLVCGSRHWTDRTKMTTKLNAIREVCKEENMELVIVHGDAPRGADRMAREWAEGRGVEHEPHPADWEKYGKSAGFKRNEEMAKTKPNYCLAFRAPGRSNGTDHMIEQCKKHGIKGLIVRSS